MNSQKIMEILRTECRQELEAALTAEKMLKRTLNPFERRRLKDAFTMFSYHHVALLRAIKKIEREEKKLQD